MSLLGDLRMYGRFARGLPGFLRNTKTLDDAREVLRRRLAGREENFLRLMETGVFGYAKSPYLPLLQLAGWEMSDIRREVAESGLEHTVRSLREAGVYFTFEQFKGLEPAHRSGQTFHVTARDFDNPYLSASFQHTSSGSTGAGTRIDTDLDFLSAQIPHHILTQHMHGVLDSPRIIWRPMLPSGSGINYVLRNAHMDRVTLNWYTPVVREDIRPSLKYHLASRGTVAIGRLLGVPLPWPEPVRLNEALVVARRVADTVQAHGSCLLIAPVSCALRVAIAGLDAGLDLSGATFMIAGEPATPAKVNKILESGARYFTTYGMAESGRIAMGCGAPSDSNDLHFLEDSFVLLQYPREVPGGGGTVDAFNLTSLLPSSPKIMLNVETDDYGIVEERSCGCLLEEFGFTKHLREIYSFRKLSGEGTTLVGSEMLEILEEVLPARFGGTPLDYQLLEEEDRDGFTRLSLVVSPRIELAVEHDVIDTVIEELGRASVAADMSRAIWSSAQTFRVKRAEPVWTSHAKLMPLRVERAADSGDSHKS